jgi:hypothetical protein
MFRYSCGVNCNDAVRVDDYEGYKRVRMRKFDDQKTICEKNISMCRGELIEFNED